MRKNELDEAMTQIRQNNQLGAVGWQTIYSNDNKIAIYTYTHLLAIDVSKGKESLYGAIDLQELGTNYIQGDVITCFSFSPNGEHVVINNAGTSSLPENAMKCMYLCAVRSGSVKKIGQEDYHNIVDAWSDNGSYYAYATKKDGEKIYISYIQQPKFSQMQYL
ncbi:MAG: hypothetical protein Q7J85_04100 [Bacillota bacterium]|nr:hypothetical protein [Bacillota bacterium]